MKTYLIAYDLMRPGQDYKRLFDAITSLGAHWHFLDSAWMVRTTMSAAQIRDYLLQFMDANDKLFVAGMSGEAAWRSLGEKGDTWIKQQLQAA